MLRYYSGERPEVSDVVQDGCGTSWIGTVTEIISPENGNTFGLADGDSAELIDCALMIDFEELKGSVIESEPENELILLRRATP